MIKALSAGFAAFAAAFATSLACGFSAMAQDRAGDFDYYLLALTWTPSWCAAEGAWDQRQCQRGLGFTLHGLWPQNEAGWPEYCDSDVRDPSRRQTGAMADIMGSDSLAWYEWKKHGRCTGLPADAYFATARRLYGALNLPAPNDGRATAAALEAAFLAVNPAFTPDSVIVTCGGGRVSELRLCLTREFAPRPCGAEVLGDACRSRGPLELPPAD